MKHSLTAQLKLDANFLSMQATHGLSSSVGADQHLLMMSLHSSAPLSSRSSCSSQLKTRRARLMLYRCSQQAVVGGYTLLGYVSVSRQPGKL